MRHIQRLLSLSLVAVLTGCVGNPAYLNPDYHNGVANTPSLEVEDARIGLAVTDARPYVLSGDKPDSYVGYNISGIRNGGDVSVRGGSAFTDQVELAIADVSAANGLMLRCLNVPATDSSEIALAAANDGLNRVVTLEVREWQTQYMTRSQRLNYDLVLRVYDAQGTQLAEASSTKHYGLTEGGKQFAMDPFKGNSVVQIQRAVSHLFADADIAAALDT